MKFEASMLSAYLDNELSESERRLVENQLRKEPQLKTLLESLQALHSQLQSLPKEAFSNDPVESVRAKIALGAQQHEDTPPTNSDVGSHLNNSNTSDRRKTVRPWVKLLALTAAAGLLAILYFAPPRPYNVANFERETNDLAPSPEVIEVIDEALAVDTPEPMVATTAQPATTSSANSGAESLSRTRGSTAESPSSPNEIRRREVMAAPLSPAPLLATPATAPGLTEERVKDQTESMQRSAETRNIPMQRGNISAIDSRLGAPPGPAQMLMIPWPGTRPVSMLTAPELEGLEGTKTRFTVVPGKENQAGKICLELLDQLGLAPENPLTGEPVDNQQLRELLSSGVTIAIEFKGADKQFNEALNQFRQSLGPALEEQPTPSSTRLDDAQRSTEKELVNAGADPRLIILIPTAAALQTETRLAPDNRPLPK